MLRKLPLWLLGLLAASLGLLLAHAARYNFLTDDSFISFRYAHNLAHGGGLVFNPGHEHVEGYTNFLWVLILAGTEWLGLAPENTANILSLALTAGLWALVVGWGVRGVRDEKYPAWVLVAPLLLACTRSVAVWATSGLETRLFEFLVVAAVLRLLVEIEPSEDPARPAPRAPLAGLLFGLASLTRPDGPLMALCCFGAAAFYLLRSRRFQLGAFARSLAPFVLLTGAHLAFRLAYYHDWLPNTYYAKVGGKLWLSSGLRYLAAFFLEYGMWVWAPLVYLGWRFRQGRGETQVPLLFAAAVAPHAVFIALIGGDHFEYRPLDLYFPFLYLLAQDGVRWVSARPRGPALALAWLAVSVVFIVDLPWRSHVEFPKHYMAGFPGVVLGEPEAAGFLDPARDPLYRTPGLRQIAGWHRALIDSLSQSFAGIRQEEHKMFLVDQEAEGRRLGEAVRRGTLPPDAYIAVDCVGAIPYFSGLRVLDRLGLNDAHVAHSEFHGKRVMAHGKRATLDYAREAGVELWAAHFAKLLWQPTDERFIRMFWRGAPEGDSFFVARVEPGWWMAVELPQGSARTAARFPALTFQGRSQATMRGIVADARVVFEARLEKDPGDLEAVESLAYILRNSGDYPHATALFQRLTEKRPEEPENWAQLAVCRIQTGDVPGGVQALRTALERARALGRAVDAARYEKSLNMLSSPTASPVPGAPATP